jgi:hypothetical protein
MGLNCPLNQLNLKYPGLKAVDHRIHPFRAEQEDNIRQLEIRPFVIF